MIDDTRRSTQTLDGDRSVCEAVVSAVAEATGLGPAEVEPRLNDAVDADSLESLVRNDGPGRAPRVAFDWAGCAVVVEHDRLVVATTDGADCRDDRSRNDDLSVGSTARDG